MESFELHETPNRENPVIYYAQTGDPSRGVFDNSYRSAEIEVSARGTDGLLALFLSFALVLIGLYSWLA